MSLLARDPSGGGGWLGHSCGAVSNGSITGGSQRHGDPLSTPGRSGEPLAKAGFHYATPSVIPHQNHPPPPPPCASVSMQMQPKPQGGNQKATYLLKFTTPFGIPVGVSKAGRSFSPSLMAFIRNTWKGRVEGHCESWQMSPPRLLDPEWEGY